MMEQGKKRDSTGEEVHIASVAVATPAYTMDQGQAEAFLMKHFQLSSKSRAAMHKIYSHRSVLRRHFAFDDPESLVEEDPDSRIARFTHWAVELSSQAANNALDRVGLSAEDVSGLVVNTCTGYICPGLSSYLIEKLGLSGRVRSYDLVGSGCGGAVPNLQICEAMLKGIGEGVVLSVSVEICSATFQMGDDLGLIVSNAIFADGASSSVLWRRPEGLALVTSSSRHVPKKRDDIRYVYKNGQLYNQLSTDIPELVARTVERVVTELLKPGGIEVEDITHWALHPGGEKVIDAIKDRMGLTEAQLRPTRNVLANYGNMSSPTVWFVLREILDSKVLPGEMCIMVTFGAGFSAHAYLIEA